MDNENKIEFYQVRSLEERLSATANFLQQNGGVLYKNIIIPVIPLVLLFAYSYLEYVKIAPMLAAGDTSVLASPGIILFVPVALILSLFLYSMTGAVMSLYEKDKLSKEIKWSDLSGKMFSNAGKTFLIGIAMFLIIITISAFLGLILGNIGISGFVGFLLIILFITLSLPITLIIYPAYFEGAPTFASIKKGYLLGLKNWGTTFVVLLVVIVAEILIGALLFLPFQLYTMFNPDGNAVLMYALAILFSFTNVLTTPFVLVFFAFQYFSIAEKEAAI